MIDYRQDLLPERFGVPESSNCPILSMSVCLFVPKNNIPKKECWLFKFFILERKWQLENSCKKIRSGNIKRINKEC